MIIGPAYIPIEGRRIGSMSIYTVCINCKEIVYEHTSDGSCLFAPTSFVGIQHMECWEYITKDYSGDCYCGCINAPAIEI